MKRRALRIMHGGLNTKEAQCPFCGYYANMSNPVNYCAGCGSTHYKNSRGQYIFNNKKISPFFYIQQAGGMKIGR